MLAVQETKIHVAAHNDNIGLGEMFIHFAAMHLVWT